MKHGFRQRGLGLVELMVGITIGLIVAAAASVLAVNQITDHRRLMLEMQIQQDLRAAADLLQQDMRRAGFRGDASYGAYLPASGVGAVIEQPARPALPNPYTELTAVDTAELRSLEYSYARDAAASSVVGTREQFGIRWDKRAKVLALKIGTKVDGTGNWQPITDPTTVEIIDFDIRVRTQDIELQDFCEQACVGPACPRQQVRRVDFLLRGKAVHDKAVVRTLSGSERVRADAVIGACPT